MARVAGSDVVRRIPSQKFAVDGGQSRTQHEDVDYEWHADVIVGFTQRLIPPEERMNHSLPRRKLQRFPQLC